MKRKFKKCLALTMSFLVLMGMFGVLALAVPGSVRSENAVRAAKGEEVEFTSISINTLPKKLHYAYGEPINTNGLIINQYYSDGSFTPVHEGFTCTAEDFNTTGKHTITVRYNGFTCTYDVWVSRAVIESVSIKTLPGKTEYYQRDTLDTNGLTLELNYVDKTSETITSGFTCTPQTLETAGKQTVKVDFYGLVLTFDVTVNELKVSESQVITAPSKLNYVVGDAFDPTGLSIAVTYNSGEAETVTEGFTWTPEVLDTLGDQTVTVSYFDAFFEFKVTVVPLGVEQLDIWGLPRKLEYLVNETLNTSGLTLYVLYNNGDRELVKEGFTCTSAEFTEAGIYWVTVTYMDGTAEFPVNVKNPSPTGISVKTLPEKTVYEVGDTLDTKGLMLEVSYNDGTKRVVTEGFTCLPAKFMAVSENQIVTVVYKDCTASFTVKVNKKTVGVTGFTIPSELELYKNDKERLIPKVTPENADNQNIIWTSSNDDVATVDENGIVTATGRGTAVITATTEDGSFTDTCKVTVKYTWWQWIVVILFFGWIWY